MFYHNKSWPVYILVFENASVLYFTILKPDQNIFPGVKMRADYV